MSPDHTFDSAFAPVLPERLRAHLGEIEAAIARIAADMSNDSPAAIQNVLGEHRQRFYHTMATLGAGILDYLAEDPPPDELRKVRAQVAAPIRAWSATSPIFNRLMRSTANGPRDFEVPALVVENRTVGADVSALILNDFYLHSVAAEALRNRYAILAPHLLQEVARCSEAGANPVQVLNLKCDSGSEWGALIDEPEFSAAQITCLDEDTAALRAARGRLGTRLPAKPRFLRINPLKYGRSPLRPSRPYEVCYAAGLFDYLTSDQAIALIRDCYALLATGGVFILGCPTSGVPANERIIIAWVFELTVHYRDEQDFRRMFAQTPFGVEELVFEREPLGADMLVIARRS